MYTVSSGVQRDYFAKQHWKKIVKTDIDVFWPLDIHLWMSIISNVNQGKESTSVW